MKGYTEIELDVIVAVQRNRGCVDLRVSDVKEVLADEKGIPSLSIQLDSKIMGMFFLVEPLSIVSLRSILNDYIHLGSLNTHLVFHVMHKDKHTSSTTEKKIVDEAEMGQSNLRTEFFTRENLMEIYIMQLSRSRVFTYTILKDGPPACEIRESDPLIKFLGIQIGKIFAVPSLDGLGVTVYRVVPAVKR